MPGSVREVNQSKAGAVIPALLTPGGAEEIMNKKKKEYLVDQVLDLLKESERGLTRTQICQQLSETYSKIHSLVTTLELLKYVSCSNPEAKTSFIYVLVNDPPESVKKKELFELRKIKYRRIRKPVLSFEEKTKLREAILRKLADHAQGLTIGDLSRAVNSSYSRCEQQVEVLVGLELIKKEFPEKQSYIKYVLTSNIQNEAEYKCTNCHQKLRESIFGFDSDNKRYSWCTPCRTDSSNKSKVNAKKKRSIQEKHGLGLSDVSKKNKPTLKVDTDDSSDDDACDQFVDVMSMMNELSIKMDQLTATNRTLKRENFTLKNKLRMYDEIDEEEYQLFINLKDTLLKS